MTAWSFTSDNFAPACPEILEAMTRANFGDEPSFGLDRLSAHLARRVADVFEHEVFLFPCPTGTAANGLALSAVCPPYGEIIAHREAHILSTEIGTVEFYIGGGRIRTLPDHDRPDQQQLDAETLAAYLASAPGPTDEHIRRMPPYVLSLTQATEAGTVYPIEAIGQLAGLGREHGLRVHLDGARFANALVSLDANPADMTWKAGIDLVSFGTTKNGTVDAESVLCFDAELARELAFRHNRAGLLASKARFAAAQLLAYFDDDLWLKMARTANQAAGSLADCLTSLPGTELVYPVQANEIFVRLPKGITDALGSHGFSFRPWKQGSNETAAPIYRLVTSFQTGPSDIKRFCQACNQIR